MQRPHQMVSITLLATALLSGILAVGCGRQAQTQPPPPVPEVATITISPR